jgi:hypothetical protein
MAMRACVAILALGACACAARADWVAINLTPAGYRNASVFAVTATAQFGEAARTSAPFSVRLFGWHGTASSGFPLNLDPQVGGAVYGASGSTQVGVISNRACLWYGTPESRVDLHPEGYWGSGARPSGDLHSTGGYKAA